jgi:hypothetical protein
VQIYFKRLDRHHDQAPVHLQRPRIHSNILPPAPVWLHQKVAVADQCWGYATADGFVLLEGVQLLNGDADSGSQIRVSNLAITQDILRILGMILLCKTDQ